MDSEGDSSSDESLSKPAPIPALLLRSGPITLKAFQAACERTPAQPRRSRGGQLRAVITEDEQISSASRIEDLQIFQTSSLGTKARKSRTDLRNQTRRASAYDLPASQSSEFNRSPVSSPEPAGNIDDIESSATHKNRRTVKSRPKKSSFLDGDPFSRISGCKKVKKRYTARRISPISSDTDVMPTVVLGEGKPMNLKKRRLPTENELVLVPVLGVRQSSEIALPVDSDPIEETQANATLDSKRAARTPSQSRRQPLRSIQNNLRLPLQGRNPSSGAFSFRALKNTLPTSKSPMRDLAREGFDDHELVLPPKIRPKKTRSGRACLTIPTLDLVNVRDHQELSLTFNPALLQQANYTTPGIDATLQLSHQCGDAPLVDTALMANDTAPQEEVVMTLPKQASKLCPPLQSRPSKQLRRVSFSSEVQSQLLSVTAPTREPSDSEDDYEAADFRDSDIESASEADESNVEEFEEMNFAEARANTFRNAELDNIEDEELLLEGSNNQSDVNNGFEPYMNRPGQFARMRSSGRLNEVPEDCIEINSSSDPANRVPGYLSRYHSSVTEPASTRTPKPLKSILKNRGDLRRVHHPSRPDAQSVQIHAELGQSSYFSRAQHELDSTARRHSIVPRRHSQQVHREFPVMEDGNSDSGSGSEVEASTPVRVSDSSQFFPATSAIPRLSTNIPALLPSLHTPAPNLRTLARRVSQDFGTTATRLRRTPSLPFNPPFLKDRG